MLKGFQELSHYCFIHIFASSRNDKYANTCLQLSRDWNCNMYKSKLSAPHTRTYTSLIQFCAEICLRNECHRNLSHKMWFHYEQALHLQQALVPELFSFLSFFLPFFHFACEEIDIKGEEGKERKKNYKHFIRLTSKATLPLLLIMEKRTFRHICM